MSSFSWQRIPSQDLPLPEGQKLLAPGQIVDERTAEIIDFTPKKYETIEEGEDEARVI